MAKFKHLSKTKLDDVCQRLWQVHSALNGAGSLFEFQSRDACYSPDELFGMGQIFKQLSRELEVLEDILRCGYDSKNDQWEDYLGMDGFLPWCFKFKYQVYN